MHALAEQAELCYLRHMEAAKLTPDVSIVQKLLKDVSDTNVTVASLLRTAKIIATKLKQDEALVWIDRELNGYPSELDCR